jgi:hypothetical protein
VHRRLDESAAQALVTGINRRRDGILAFLPPDDDRADDSSHDERGQYDHADQADGRQQHAAVRDWRRRRGLRLDGDDNRLLGLLEQKEHGYASNVSRPQDSAASAS